MIRVLILALFVVPFSGAAAPLTSVLSKSGVVRTEKIVLPNLVVTGQYSLLYSINPLRALTADARVDVEVAQGSVVLASKTLHQGDADYYVQFRVPAAGSVTVSVRASKVNGNYILQANRWPLSPFVKSSPSQRWQDAQTMPLGKTIFASGDDQPYIPIPGTPRRAVLEGPAGTDWYKFEFTSDVPKLVFFQVDLMERDQIPVDVAIHRVVNGKLEGYYEGEDPVTLPHEAQALPGNKFTPRILKEKGTYYVSVRANHPEYKLRTRVYDVPPYRDPHTAVRTALDYVLAAGDSWHGNLPRKGGILDRVSSLHQETSLCVGCHVTHFPLRAQLYATRNGYPVVQRQQLQFLTERFYNNPRPFYGFEQQAVWARMISAPANVLGRMSHLIDLFEDQITRERRVGYHESINGYLNLYYTGRDKLPPDETNGNTPLVSAHEVAWYAWASTKDAHLGELIAAGEVKNMIDLCYQTLALAEIDRTRYQGQIQKNAERILSLQRPDGQWSMRFEPNQPEVEFQTGHALWALQAAGIPATHPSVAKGIEYLLNRQQVFGGWMDPKQSFENFRTPFRETQMAILALSSYFPQAGRAKGWNAPVLERLSTDPVEILDQLDSVWDTPSAEVRKRIQATTESSDPLLRQAAAEALGRLGDRDDSYIKLLGDPAKMVQRTAAWAMRQSYSRRITTPSDDLLTALSSTDDRTRWGATRVFATHFAAIARRPEMASALTMLVEDQTTSVRMNAVRGLWQLWFWSSGSDGKGQIEDVLLGATAKPQADWVEENLRAAIYNLADENIRYLYNNWVPLMGRSEDRERAIRGRLGVESRLASKFATILEKGPDSQKKILLRALTEFPLRRGDIYDLEADVRKPVPPVYNRIGNDIEQIAFFGESADQMAKAIEPLVESQDADLRRLAVAASLLVRDSRFADVNRLAGPVGAPVKSFVAKVEKLPEGEALRPPRPTTTTANSNAPRPQAARGQVRLDEAFFRGYVEPILQKRGRDGYACVHCHASHTLFDGTWSTARNVVDPADPENSLILRKPTSSSETEGIAGSTVLSHGGGIRFAKDSPEYVTILEWIKGAKE